MNTVAVLLLAFFGMGTVAWVEYRILTRKERRYTRLRHRLNVKANYHQEWPGWDRRWFPAWKHHKPRFKHMCPRKGTPEELERHDNRYT